MYSTLAQPQSVNVRIAINEDLMLADYAHVWGRREPDFRPKPE